MDLKHDRDRVVDLPGADIPAYHAYGYVDRGGVLVTLFELGERRNIG